MSCGQKVTGPGAEPGVAILVPWPGRLRICSPAAFDTLTTPVTPGVAIGDVADERDRERAVGHGDAAGRDLERELAAVAAPAAGQVGRRHVLAAGPAADLLEDVGPVRRRDLSDLARYQP